jgi:hypothetical protein
MEATWHWQDPEFNMASLLLADSNDDSHLRGKHTGNDNLFYENEAVDQRVSSEPSNIHSSGYCAEQRAQGLDKSCNLRIGDETVDTRTTEVNLEHRGSLQAADTALDLNFDDFIIWPESVEDQVTEKVGSQASSKREVTPRHPPQSVKVLDEWLRAHLDRPYASREEVEDLADTTKLSPLQVRRFLTNRVVRFISRSK